MELDRGIFLQSTEKKDIRYVAKQKEIETYLLWPK